MNFNFTNWHLVPRDATIPAGTPYWRVEPDTSDGFYVGRGLSYDLDLGSVPSDYYTEEPIISPSQEVIENRARNMYYLTGGTGWEYESLATKEKWRNLAAKYVEKEADK